MLHLILGPMFSGKSTRLIYHIRQFKTLDYPLCIVKPDIDKRYSANEICTHNLDKEPCHVLAIDSLPDIFNLPEYKTAKVVMIEEAQFFNHLLPTIQTMLDIDKKIIYITALNGDSNRNVFGDIPLLLPLCYHIDFLHALCQYCKDGTPAIYSKRNSHDDTQIKVAGKDVYEAVCLNHFFN